MIVPSMSKEEIIKEILFDFEMVKRKSEYVIKDLISELSKTKKFPFEKAFDYVTPKTKNKWIYIIQLKTKNDIFQTFVNYHDTSIGIRAGLMMTNKEIVFFTGHLFKRFAEREKLDIASPIDKMKRFFTQNPVLNYDVLEKFDDGAREIIGRVKTGVVLGIRNKKNILVCNTYLSNEMLRNDQTLIANSLKAEIDYYLSTKNPGLI